MLNFLISNAYAATTTATTATGSAQQANGNLMSMVMLIGLIVVFYFLLWRPQAKRAKEHRNLISNLAKGDEVITSGGLMGKVSKLTDDFIVLMIAENVEVKVQKGSVTAVLPKGTLNVSA